MEKNDQQHGGQGLPAPDGSRTAETPEVDSHVHLNNAKKLERERNEARRMWSVYQDKLAEIRQWVANAAPILSRAACIVVEEAPERLREIEGVRAIIETCPVDFISENVTTQGGQSPSLP